MIGGTILDVILALIGAIIAIFLLKPLIKGFMDEMKDEDDK